jgi:uridine kinase
MSDRPLDQVVALIERAQPAKRGTILVAIDGYGGAGKTTLAGLLASAVPHTSVVHTDDFVFPGELSGWGWPRFNTQVLQPLLVGRPGRYQRYDWRSGDVAEWHDVSTGGLAVCEGVSILRHELGDPWDVKIWIDCPHEVRLRRGVERDGVENRWKWEQIWIPEEDEYFLRDRPDVRADLILDGTRPFDRTQTRAARAQENSGGFSEVTQPHESIR